MLASDAGLFRVDSQKRTKKEQRNLDKHPWAPRINRCLHEAGEFGADWVYFRLHTQTGGPRAEIFIYEELEQLSEGSESQAIAELHLKLWNYGGVPLVFFLKPTGVDVFNILQQPEITDDGLNAPDSFAFLELSAAETLATAGATVAGIQKKKAEQWERFRSEHFDNGGFWEMPENRQIGDAEDGALPSLVREMREVRIWLRKQLSSVEEEKQRDLLIRRLLIVILMIRFLEERGILPPDYFSSGDFPNSSSFLEVLGNLSCC